VIGMLSHPFMVHALVAGTAVALVAGPVGYLLVLRGQVFGADALSHVTFTGALAALAAGSDARVGLLAAALVGAPALGLLGRRGRPDDVAIGAVFAFVLGLGVLFLSLYSSGRSGRHGTAGVGVLFGSVLGLDAGQVTLTTALAGAVLVALVVLARPLLFSTVDEAVAQARGVPVRLLGLGFLLLLGVTVAQATQVVGALLILGLIAAPGGAAARLSSRPGPAMVLAALIAVGSIWIGLTAGYALPSMPPSFSVIAVATTVFAVTALPWRRLRDARR
jgi:zinc/manganese transport system permease protein